jgi:A/G-specific adenine glycosylase
VENPKSKFEETAAAPLPLVAEARSFRARLARWFKSRGRDLPWRRTHDPYAIMVSEFMLQQTQVATVLDYYRRWLARFPDFAALAAATEDDVLHAWQGLGYYSRARNLHRAAQAIHAQYGGRPPRDPALLEALPGVGRYTAGAIATFAFDRAVPIIDANIARVIARLLDLQEPIDSARGGEILWTTAAMLLPKNRGRLHNSALMELGALVCAPRNPSCLLCPVRVHCRAKSPESLPKKKPRRKTVALAEDCAWIIDQGRLLLEQQTGPRWRGLWKLPRLPERRSNPKLLLSLEYPFTHHRVTLSVFAVPRAPALSPGQQWIPLGEMSAIALAAPHRRAIKRLAGS